MFQNPCLPTSGLPSRNNPVIHFKSIELLG